jgi:hypothetical protein
MSVNDDYYVITVSSSQRGYCGLKIDMVGCSTGRVSSNNRIASGAVTTGVTSTTSR